MLRGEDSRAEAAPDLRSTLRLDGLAGRQFSVYVHVPFCASRCGYCDFNTYTARELGGGASQDAYAATAISEIRLARRQIGDAELPVQTVFFGGGTPTLLPATDLVRLLAAVRSEFGLAPDAEVTTEANPESVDRAYLEELLAGGFTRISFGMQSARSHVLATLDRRHTAGGAERAVAEAVSAGFGSVNLDLIYGTPGESDDDWAASLDAAVSTGADHVSAYALIVEDGTRLAASVRRGVLPAPDDDVLADRYLMAEERLSAAGFGWYEVSNWARQPAAACRHNLAYWRGDNWWGIGPGAHSHLSDGTAALRWWNVKHPRTYAERLASGEGPVDSSESLSAETRQIEDVLLRTRLAEGCPVALLSAAGRHGAEQAAADGMLLTDALRSGRVALTLRGRLLADAVVRMLLA